MTQCKACQSPIPPGARFCPECGAPVHASSQIPTELAGGAPGPAAGTGRAPGAATPGTPHPRDHASSSSSTGFVSEGRFTAGTILAGRYRIIGRLGRGGMGEVYRADDLTLGVPVALKFLPEGLEAQGDRMTRFLSEVRIARQISHANVCRVYDIVEADGQRFISMEYVDGEDLASLLRRIGRYPGDKGVEIARQICAGLAAAHERGVLHRDLKPANIMIDGRGKVRITDFGLAGLAGSIEGAEIQAGTPAYMAPEQLRGREVTVRSDIYSLGLVLYEMFTGRPALTAESRAELLRGHATSSVPTPTSVKEDIDPAAERIILRCLEVDPADRPASALAVAAALPGGDPLAAALAAGETPSPEMVAAAGEEGALKPAIAWALLVTGLALCLGGALIASRWKLDRFVDLPIPAAALEVQAGDLVRELDHDAPVGDSASGFEWESGPIDWVKENDDSADRWTKLHDVRPGPLSFWYRQSPRSMLAWPNFSTVDYGNPPQSRPGMARVRLDPRGRLESFEAMPEAYDDSKGPWAPPDWSLLFQKAGLDMASFEEVPPAWTPAMASDSQAAWEGPDPDRADLTLHIEAAAYHGRPVSFILRGPWEKPPELKAEKTGLLDWLKKNLDLALLTIGILAVGIVLARRNVRAGRGDTRGALKLAFWFFVMHTIVWALWASHVADLSQEWRIVQADVGYNLFLAANLGLLYVALEPYVRRRWPDSIISWSRILRGRFTDPLVGRDILIGGLFGGVFVLLRQSAEIVPALLGRAIVEPTGLSSTTLNSVMSSVGMTLDVGVHALLDVMRTLFFLLLLRILLRKLWIAIPVFVLIIAVVQGVPGNDLPFVVWPAFVLMALSVVYVLVRYGLVATTVGLAIFNALWGFGLRADLTLWYTPQELVPVIAVAALLVWGFKISLAGQPVFGTASLLDD